MENKNIENTNIMEDQQTLSPILNVVIPEGIILIHFPDNEAYFQLPSYVILKALVEYTNKLKG